MTIEELGSQKLRPMRDLVAFKWLPPKLKSGILIPETYYDLALRLGRFFIGEVLAVGPKVKSLKAKDKIIIHEYGIKDFRGSWKEDQIYFIEEANCRAKLIGYKGILGRPDSLSETKRIENL